MENQAIKNNIQPNRSRPKLTVVLDDGNHTEKLRRRNRAITAKKLICGLVFLFAVLMATVLITRYGEITAKNQESRVLSKRMEELEANRDYLVMKLEPYKATARIESLAKINLGMDYPTQEQIVYIASGYQEDQPEVETNQDYIAGFRNFFSALLGTNEGNGYEKQSE